MSSTEKLQALYDNEINFEISCFFDAGVNVRLGDEMNGWRTECENFDTFERAIEWLWETCCELVLL